MKMFAAPSLLAALVTSSSGLAQGDHPLRFFGIEPESFTGIIDTERPNFSTSPVPLFAGHLQVEGGLQFTRMEGDSGDFTLPLGLLRAGLAENLELQVGWDGYSFSEVGEDSFAGANDITVALKTQFTEQTGAVPAIGLLGQLSLPTGSSDTTSNVLDPSLGVLWTYDLQTIGLFGTTSFNLVTEDDERVFQSSTAAGVAFPVAGRFSGYVEYFGVFSARGGPTHLVNTALQYLINGNLLVDVVVGGGLNERAADYFIGSGASYRW